ncbi:MAG: alpha/beta hydrolase [Cyanophyceae cyanobacterium]
MGFHTHPYKYDFSVSQTTEILVEVMDSLDISYASLSFTCANGFFALGFAKIHPNRVSHLVLAQTPSFEFMRQWNERIIPKILHVPYLGQAIVAGFSRKLSSRWYNKALPQNSEHKSQFVEYADQTLKAGGRFCLASLVQGLRPIKDSEINEISAPTLLIYGNRDRSHRHTDFTSLRDHAPKAEIIKFQGCGHFPDLERPREYSEHVKRFINTAA